MPPQAIPPYTPQSPESAPSTVADLWSHKRTARDGAALRTGRDRPGDFRRARKCQYRAAPATPRVRHSAAKRSNTGTARKAGLSAWVGCGAIVHYERRLRERL